MIGRAELLDETPGPPNFSLGYPGRHVLQSLPDGSIEFFYIDREGGEKQRPLMPLPERVRAWFQEHMQP